MYENMNRLRNRSHMQANLLSVDHTLKYVHIPIHTHTLCAMGLLPASKVG